MYFSKIISYLSRRADQLYEKGLQLLPATVREKLSRNILLEKIVKGTSWNTVGMLGGQLAMVLASIVNVRMVGPTRFGEFALVLSTIGTLGILSGNGLGFSMIKYVAEFRTTDVEKMRRITGVCLLFSLISTLVLCLLVLFGTRYVGMIFPKTGGLEEMLRLGALLLALESLCGILRGVLIGFEQFKWVSIIELYSNLLYLPLSILLAYIWGVYGLLISYILLRVIAAVSCFYVTAKIWRQLQAWPLFRNCFQELRVIFGFAIPHLFCQMLLSPVHLWAMMVMGRCDGGMVQVTVCNIAERWRRPLTFTPQLIGNVTYPVLANLYGEKQWQVFFRLNEILCIVFFAVALLPALVLIPASGWIMSWYGAELRIYYMAFIWAVIGAVLVVASIPFGQLLWTSNRVAISVFSCVLEAGSFAAIFYVFRSWGAAAYMMAFAISSGVRALVQGGSAWNLYWEHKNENKAKA